MATLIPAIGTRAFGTADGCWVFELLEQKLDGHAWDDMAVPCADINTRDLWVQVRHERKPPLENRLGAGDLDTTSDKIKVMNMHASKGSEFPVVARPGVGHMPVPSEDEKEAARVFYVAATRATQSLVIGVGGDGKVGKRLNST